MGDLKAAFKNGTITAQSAIRSVYYSIREWSLSIQTNQIKDRLGAYINPRTRSQDDGSQQQGGAKRKSTSAKRRRVRRRSTRKQRSSRRI